MSETFPSGLLPDQFTITEGFTPELAAKIVENSRQPLILAMAPRDASERFTDVETAMRWFHSSSDRQFYSLARASQLAGVLWFTKKALEDAEYTLAIRMYDPFVGQGLGTLFSDDAHRRFMDIYEGNTWADINVDNHASQRLAFKSGYRRISESLDPGSDRLQMIRRVNELPILDAVGPNQ